MTRSSRTSGAPATVEVLDDAAIRARRASQERARREQLARLQVNLRPEVVDLVVRDALEAWPALRQLWAWEKKLGAGGRRTLALTGPCRTGKTTAAAWLAARVPCEWVCAGELAGRVEPWREDLARGVDGLELGSYEAPVYRNGVHYAGDTERRPLTPLIVLDDLGTENVDDKRFGRALYQLVEDRMRHGLLVITGNLSTEELEERYGDRIAGRLEEIADVATVPRRASRPA